MAQPSNGCHAYECRVFQVGSLPRDVWTIPSDSDNPRLAPRRRSHSIFSISLEMMAVEEGCKPGPVSARSLKLSGKDSKDLDSKDLSCLGSGRIRRGKLNLVDLAGSERQSKTGMAPCT